MMWTPRSQSSEGLASVALLPTIAGIGAGAAAIGNHLVVIASVVAAAIVIQSAVVKVWQWSRARWLKLDKIRDNSDRVPALEVKVDATTEGLAEVGRRVGAVDAKLDTLLALLAAGRDPSSRTRSTD